jgi:hypothetical protein
VLLVDEGKSAASANRVLADTSLSSGATAEWAWARRLLVHKGSSAELLARLPLMRWDDSCRPPRLAGAGTKRHGPSRSGLPSAYQSSVAAVQAV